MGDEHKVSEALDLISSLLWPPGYADGMDKNMPSHNSAANERATPQDGASQEKRISHLEALIRAQIRAASVAAEEHAQTIDFKVSGDPRPVSGDAGCLSQAVAYMLLNAVHSSRPGSCVHALLEFGASEAVLSVRAAGAWEAPQYVEATLESARATLAKCGGSLRVGSGPDGGVMAAALPLRTA